jgi:hypothetical protein
MPIVDVLHESSMNEVGYQKQTKTDTAISYQKNPPTLTSATAAIAISITSINRVYHRL